MVKAKFKAFPHILNIIVYCSSVYSGSGLVIKAESLYDSYLRATYLFYLMTSLSALQKSIKPLSI